MHRHRLRQILPSVLLAAHLALLPWFATLHAASHTGRVSVERGAAECTDAHSPAHRDHLDRSRVHVDLDCELCLSLNSLQKRQILSNTGVTPAPAAPAVRADTAAAHVRSRVQTARPLNKSPPLFN